MKLEDGNRFLLHCIKLWGVDDPKALESLQQLVSEAPENLLYSVSHDTTLAPLVYHVLKKRGLMDIASAPLEERLKTFYHFTAARNAVIFRNLSEFLQGAQQRGFPVMLLKGLALIAGGYYPDKGLRFLSDIDVLVKMEDVAKADDLMVELGWNAPKRIPLPQQLKAHHHLSAVTTPEGVTVEVHFRLSRLPLKIDLDAMWRRATPIPSLSPSAYLPSPEDLLIHLTLNTSLHHPDRLLQQHLKFLADLEALYHGGNGSLDWEYIFTCARKAGIEVAVTHPLVLSYELLNQDWLKDELEREGVLTNVHWDFINQLASDIREGRQIPEMSWMVARMGEARGLVDKLKILLRIIFPSWGELSEVYPKWASSPFWFLAYVQRIFHLIGTFRWENFKIAYKAGSVIRAKPSLEHQTPSATVR